MIVYVSSVGGDSFSKLYEFLTFNCNAKEKRVDVCANQLKYKSCTNCLIYTRVGILWVSFVHRLMRMLWECFEIEDKILFAVLNDIAYELHVVTIICYLLEYDIKTELNKHFLAKTISTWHFDLDFSFFFRCFVVLCLVLLAIASILLSQLN